MNQTSSKSSTPLHLSMDDNGSHLSLPKGQEIRLQLRANPSTGFDWHIGEMDVTIVMETARAYQADSDAPGSPTDLNITYRLVGIGTTRLVLHYQRSWEKDIPPLQSFVLNIAVLET